MDVGVWFLGNGRCCLAPRSSRDPRWTPGHRGRMAQRRDRRLGARAMWLEVIEQPTRGLGNVGKAREIGHRSLNAP
jgi:hypothetical protein